MKERVKWYALVYVAYLAGCLAGVLFVWYAVNIWVIVAVPLVVWLVLPRLFPQAQKPRPTVKNPPRRIMHQRNW